MFDVARKSLKAWLDAPAPVTPEAELSTLRGEALNMASKITHLEQQLVDAEEDKKAAFRRLEQISGLLPRITVLVEQATEDLKAR